MSTKITISASNHYHLYEEWLDDSVWLEVRVVPFEASQHGVSVQLPPAVIDAIRAAAPDRFPHLRPKETEQ